MVEFLSDLDAVDGGLISGKGRSGGMPDPFGNRYSAPFQKMVPKRRGVLSVVAAHPRRTPRVTDPFEEDSHV